MVNRRVVVLGQAGHTWVAGSESGPGQDGVCLSVLKDPFLKEPLFDPFWDGVVLRGDWVQLSLRSKVMERSGQLGLALEAGEQGHSFAESPKHNLELPVY